MTTNDYVPTTVDHIAIGATDLASTAKEAYLSHEHDPPGEAPIETADEVHDVVVALREVAAALDVTELLSTIDWASLPAAIDLEDVPEAIVDRKPRAAVELRSLVSLADMSAVWDSVNLREFWREVRELEAEVDDLGGDDANPSQEVSDDGWFSLPGTGGGDQWWSGDSSDEGGSETGGSPDGLGAESKETLVQTQVSDAVGEFRESILAARARLREKLEANRKESDTHGGPETSSRNPTAVSLVTSRGTRVESATPSTVPEETRHSTAPNRPRIYGSRFEDGGPDA